MTPTALDVSVVICAYTEARWQDLLAAVDSVQRQSAPPREIIIVIDHNPALLERTRTHLAGVVVVKNREQRGLSGARNSGIAAASSPSRSMSTKRGVQPLAGAAQPVSSSAERNSWLMNGLLAARPPASEFHCEASIPASEWANLIVRLFRKPPARSKVESSRGASVSPARRTHGSEGVPREKNRSDRQALQTR